MDSKNGYPLDMTFPVGEASIYYYAPFIWSNGGDLISDDGLTADGYFNSDKNAEVFNYFRGLVEKKYMSATPIENLFESGRAAFKFDGAWEVNTILFPQGYISLTSRQKKVFFNRRTLCRKFI